MEVVIFLSGVSTGAFLLLGSVALVFLYKARGFRVRLGIENDYGGGRSKSNVEPPLDYFEMERRLREDEANNAEQVPRGGGQPVSPVSPGT